METFLYWSIGYLTLALLSNYLFVAYYHKIGISKQQYRNKIDNMKSILQNCIVTETDCIGVSILTNAGPALFFMTGGAFYKRTTNTIYIMKELVDLLTLSQLNAVTAHELAHRSARDSVLNLSTVKMIAMEIRADWRATATISARDMASALVVMVMHSMTLLSEDWSKLTNQERLILIAGAIDSILLLQLPRWILLQSYRLIGR